MKIGGQQRNMNVCWLGSLYNSKIDIRLTNKSIAIKNN